jgi:hypothetical protein
MAARTLCKEGIFREQFHARLVVGLAAAILGNAHVARGDAAHRALVVVKDLGRREAGEDLDAKLGRLLGQPAAEVAKAAGVVAIAFLLSFIIKAPTLRQKSASEEAAAAAAAGH